MGAKERASQPPRGGTVLPGKGRTPLCRKLGKREKRAVPIKEEERKKGREI